MLASTGDHTIWKITGDPLKVDTDGDGASDYVEITLMGTDPLLPVHVTAPEILKQQSESGVSDTLHLKTYCKMGGTFGETGIKDGTMNWLVGDNVASSFPYFTGWMASGYFVAGDVRDIAETIYQGDGTGTALNAVAFAPAVGDATKTGNTLRKLATKYSSRITEIATTLIRALPDNTPPTVFTPILDSGFLGRERLAIDELREAGKSVPEINAQVKSGEKWLIKAANAERITHFIGIPGNLNSYSASKRKTVLGTYQSYFGSTPYTEVLPKDKANFLDFATDVSPINGVLHPTNKELLDCVIDNGDEIILSIDYRLLENMSDAGNTFKLEIKYLQENGYRISNVVDPSDGLYRMVKG